MQNKILINKLKENAELAWAAYGYFHLADSKYDFNKDEIDKRRLKYFREIKAKELGGDLDENTYPTHADILNIEYKQIFKGDFAPLQAQNFFERYELLIHQPNTESSDFSATFFYNKESKALSIIFF